jgi:hypothetical protein
MPFSLNLNTLIPVNKITTQQKTKSLEKLNSNKINTKLFFLFIFIFQLALIFQGLDLSDEGFLVTFYQQIFKHPDSVQYNFMFWLTGIIGGAYYKLFSFSGLWGMRFGGVLITTGTAVVTYSLLKNFLNRNYLKLGIFLIILALNNDIKEINYNNISAFVYVTSIYFLFHGLREYSNGKLFTSGLFVSLNFFIRPPNILDLGLILAIVYYGYENKNHIKFITKQIIWFLAGFLMCTAMTLVIIYSLGHWELYSSATKLLYKLSKGGPQKVDIRNDDYALLKLVYQLKANYLKSIFIASSIIGSLLLGISFFTTFKRKFVLFNKISRLMKYLFILTILAIIFWGAIDQYFVLYFYSGIIILAFILVLLTSVDLDTKLLLFCGCFIVVTYSFGSSAGILTAGRYSFWIGLPVTINYFLNIRSIKNQLTFLRSELNNSLQIILTEKQLSVAKNILLIFLISEGLFHSFYYPFFDKRSRLEMRYSVDNKMLKGIYTTKGRVEIMNSLLQESSKYIKKGDYVLAYDCIPLYHFITESVPYLHSPYPWLYEAEIFKSELALARVEKKNLPIVVMQKIKTIGDGSKWPEQTLPTDYSQWDENQGRNKYMNEFLTENNYIEVWTNGFFKILVPNQNKN